MSALVVGYAGRDGAHAATACDELFPRDRELDLDSPVLLFRARL